MTLITSPRITSDLAKLRAAQHASHTVLITGETGVGKRTLLERFAQELNSNNIPHCLITTATTQAPPLTPDTVILIAEINRIAPHILDSLFNTPQSHSIIATRSGVPASAATLTEHTVDDTQDHIGRFTRSAHNVHIELHSHDNLVRLMHEISPHPLDIATVTKLVELSWGRPCWATHLISAIAEAPEIRTLIKKPVIDSVISRYFTEASADARPRTDSLTPEAIAHAILLAEIGPRSYSGVVDLIGFSSTHQLVTSGFLTLTPDGDDRWGVPLLFTPALIAHSDEAALKSSYQNIVSQLLAQDELGIPLTEAEERVSVFALMSHRSNSAETNFSHPRALALLTRRMQRQICFGASDPAKDLMLRLQRDGSQICALTRAKLIALLHDSHAALQSLLFDDQRSGNCVLPLNSRADRLGLMFLRGQLTASSGGSYASDDLVRTDEPEWAEALSVVQAWNRSGALAPVLSDLRRIAQHHPQVEVQLLAEMLCEVDARSQGFVPVGMHSEPFATRLTQAFRALTEETGASSKLDDVNITIVVASQLMGLYDPSVLNDLALTTRFVQRLSGDTEHTVWASHLAAAKTALHCGDIGRFELELQRCKSALPRFIPVRILHYFDEFLRACADGQARLTHTFAGQLVNYFAEQFTGVTKLPVVPHTERAEVLAQASAFTIMGAHLAASREQNPASLRRVAARLAQLELWGPAHQAFEEALKIYMGRRASGKCALVESEIADLDRQSRESVLWLTPRVDATPALSRLTRREAQTAQRVAEGFSNLEIAELMQCSVRTVESHVSNARAKVGARNRAELAQRITMPS